MSGDAATASDKLLIASTNTTNLNGLQAVLDALCQRDSWQRQCGFWSQTQL